MNKMKHINNKQCKHLKIGEEKLVIVKLPLKVRGSFCFRHLKINNKSKM
jgi:hypothetical protein